MKSKDPSQITCVITAKKRGIAKTKCHKLIVYPKKKEKSDKKEVPTFVAQAEVDSEEVDIDFEEI